MIGTLAAYRLQGRAARLLMWSVGLFNLGFYMLLPFLATHLQHGLGLALWAVGLVLGLRSFSQQGLYFLGGSLADRYGHRRLLLAGCVMRSVGFALFAFATELPILVLATLLTGLAAALYVPAAQAILSELCESNRTEGFALVSVFRGAGELLGPLLGLALLSLGFVAIGLTAAATFAVLVVVLWRVLPSAPPLPSSVRGSMLVGWRTLLRQRGFLSFALAMSGYFVLVSQLSFALPLEIERASGSEAGAAWLFTLGALFSIALQMPLSRTVSRRMSPVHVLTFGYLMMAAAFLPLLIVQTNVLHVSSAWSAAPAVLTGVLLTVASLIVYPPMMARVADSSPVHLRATAFGLFYLVAGIAVVLTNLIAGEAFALSASAGSTWPVWLGLCALALLAAAGLASGWAAPASAAAVLREAD